MDDVLQAWFILREAAWEWVIGAVKTAITMPAVAAVPGQEGRIDVGYVSGRNGR